MPKNLPLVRSSRLAPALVVAVAGAMLVSAAAWAALPPAATRDDWVEVRTRHVTVFGNSGAREAREVAQRLERLREVLGVTHPSLGFGLPDQVVVYAFREQDSFRQYRPPATENPAGFFISHDDGDLIAFHAGPLATLTLHHEYLHSVVWHSLVRVPRWLDEGLAEYYSTFRSGPSSAEIGRTVPYRLSWLRGHRLLPIEDLIMDPLETSEGFYAQSWALTHFLCQQSPDHAARFQRFLVRLQRGHPPLEAFAEVAPRERWPSLERELEAYIREGSFTFSQYTFQRPFSEVEVEVRPLPRAEALYRLGVLAMHTGDRVGRLAEDHFRASLAADPRHAQACASLGYLLDRRGDVVHAESLYSAAAEMAPGDPVPWVLAGRGAFRRYLDGSREAHTLAALGTARARFARAIQMQPGHLGALVGYGRTFRDDPDPPPEAVRAVRAAAILLPARLEIACDLAHLLARTGQCAEADSVFRERVEPLAEDDLVRAVARAVSDCRVAQVRRKPPGGER